MEDDTSNDDTYDDEATVAATGDTATKISPSVDASGSIERIILDRILSSLEVASLQMTSLQTSVNDLQAQVHESQLDIQAMQAVLYDNSLCPQPVVGVNDSIDAVGGIRAGMNPDRRKATVTSHPAVTGAPVDSAHLVSGQGVVGVRTACARTPSSDPDNLGLTSVTKLVSKEQFITETSECNYSNS